MKKHNMPLALLTLLSLMALMNLTACKTRVVSQDRIVIGMPKGKAFTPEIDGVFMSQALYERTQKAVADKVLELQKKTK